MPLLRWLLRPNAPLGIAALGMAAAMLIPLAGGLLLDGLTAERESTGPWMAYRDGGDFALAELPVDVDRAVRLEPAAPHLLAAYVVGDPLVAVDEAWPMPLAPDRPVTVAAVTEAGHAASDLVPAVAVLVHPNLLKDPDRADAALVDDPERAQALREAGFEVTPASGTHGFLVESLKQVRSGFGLLLLASTPVAGLVAIAFADLDARDQAPTTAVLSALGRPKLARLLLIGRVVLLTVLATLVAVLVAFMLAAAGNGAPQAGFAWDRMAIAVLLPAGLALTLGSLRAIRSQGAPGDFLRGPQVHVAPSPMLRKVSPLAQPILLGVRILPAVFLAGLLFMVDVGFPLVVSQMPAAFTGSPGEAVRTGSAEDLLGGSVPKDLADALHHDPAVDAAVAEVIVLTLVTGQPVLVRGGSWGELSDYHGLDLLEGGAPGSSELALGDRLASRLGAAPGEVVQVLGGGRPILRSFTVSGIYSGPGLLRDEAIAPMVDAQDLAGLDATRASIVRARPDNAGVLEALDRGDSDLRVVDLDVSPSPARQGALVTATVRVANLGPQPGVRVLDVRVDGVAVARIEAQVAGYAQATHFAYFVAPASQFEVSVNPTESVPTGPPSTLLAADPLQLDDRPIAVTATRDGLPRQGLELGLFADAASAATGTPMAQAATDSQGVATFAPQPAGSYVVATLSGDEAALEVHVGESVDAARARLVVERQWTVPTEPAPGETVMAFALVRNVGGAVAVQEVPITLDGEPIGLQSVYLLPGQAAVVQAAYRQGDAEQEVQVLGTTVEIPVPPPAPAGPVEAAAPARTSQSLQKSAADEVLGDARGTLLGLAGTALVSSVALVALAAARTCQARSRIFPTLNALGWSPQQLRRRAAVEGAWLGAAAAAAAAAVTWAVFGLAGLFQWPLAFGHVLPNPVSPLFAVQGVLAFAAVCAWAVYLAAGRVLHPDRLRRPGSEDRPTLDFVPLGRVLEDGR